MGMLLYLVEMNKLNTYSHEFFFFFFSHRPFFLVKPVANKDYGSLNSTLNLIVAPTTHAFVVAADRRIATSWAGQCGLFSATGSRPVCVGLEKNCMPARLWIPGSRTHVSRKAGISMGHKRSLRLRS